MRKKLLAVGQGNPKSALIITNRGRCRNPQTPSGATCSSVSVGMNAAIRMLHMTKGTVQKAIWRAKKKLAATLAES